MRLEKLLEYKIEGVYLTNENKVNSQNTSFVEYLPFLLKKVYEKIIGIQKEEEKKNLEIDKLFTRMQHVNIAADKDIPEENPGSEAVQKEYKMTEVKETEEIGTQTIKVIRRLQKTKSNIAKELEMSPEQKINIAIEDEYLKTMDFMDTYVE